MRQTRHLPACTRCDSHDAAGINVDINFDKKYFLVETDEQGTITIRQNITIEAVKRETVVLTGGEEIDPNTIYDNQKALCGRISELLSDGEKQSLPNQQ